MDVYFDYNATTPVDPRVIAVMTQVLRDCFGNPSSVTAPGRAARQQIDRARDAVAGLLGAGPSEIFFTSGGTESINLAIQVAIDFAGRSESADRKPARVLLTRIEHPATIEMAPVLEEHGLKLDWLGVDRHGRILLDELEEKITDETILVSVMLANNETGVIQSVREISRRAHLHGAWVHCDAVQAIGKIPVDVEELEVDYLSIAGHKFHAPKGVGALYIREGAPRPRILRGGHQEREVRPGTENVPGIAGLGEAARLAVVALASGEPVRIRALRDELWKGLKVLCPAAILNSDPEGLPNTLHVTFPGQEGDTLVIALDLDGAYVSAGSACASGAQTISPVLAAMGMSPELARGSLRISLGRYSTSEEVDHFLNKLARALEVSDLRADPGRSA